MDRNQLYPLEKVNSMVDLGVRFDNNHNLTFMEHMSEKLIRLTAYLVLLKEILFVWMNIHSFYCIKQWSAHTLNLQILFGVIQTRRYQRDRKSPE